MPVASPSGDPLSPVTPGSVLSGESDVLGALETVTSALGERTGRDSPKCHSRSSSHDSYFERKQNVQFKMDMDGEDEELQSPQMKLDSSLDISEIQVNFDLEDNEMKIFSEDETMMSNSVGSELSLVRSPLDEHPGTSSPCPGINRGVRQRSEDTLESPTKSRRMSFKEKFRKFTSPTMSRKHNETNKMVDSGVGFESDSCSGSYEAKDSCKGSRLKDKLVSALSPESSRKSEGSPKKLKSSSSPGTSPQSIVKRSKIEDDDCEMSSLNLSPSIRFIDASSSYELGRGTSSETLGLVTPQPDEHWSEGPETARRATEEEVVQAQVHQQDLPAQPLIEGPISIIGSLAGPSHSDTESAEDQNTPHTPASILSGTGTLVSQLTMQCEESHLSIESHESHVSQESHNTEESNRSQGSDSPSELSISLAGATVSENESFGLDSSNDEVTANDEERVEAVEERVTPPAGILDMGESDEQKKGTTSHGETMVEEVVSQKEELDLCRSEECEEDSEAMETDMTIVSAHLPMEIGGSLGFRQLPSFEAITDDSPAESNTSERTGSDPLRDNLSIGSSDEGEPQEDCSTVAEEPCKDLTPEKTSSGIECQTLSLVTDSTITPEFESCSPPEVVTTPPDTLPSEPVLKLSLISPQMEGVVMRRSPSSPARNRCVRSDFFSTLVDQPLPPTSGEVKKAAVVEEEPSTPPSPMEQCPLALDIPSPDIGLPPLPRTHPPKPVSALAKALSPQPYSKPQLSPHSKPQASPQPYTRPSPTPLPRTSLPSPSRPAPAERAISVEPLPAPCRVPEPSSPSRSVDRSLSEPPVPLFLCGGPGSEVEAVTLRLQSMSPMEEDHGSRSLELDTRVEDGRRSTTGIPEVRIDSFLLVI